MADRRLQVFFAVAKHRSFTRAAESLFMTQPAVTFQIKQLEEQFNTKLFERGHGKVELTEAGRLAFEHVEKILSLSEEMEGRLAEMTGQMRGSLMIGACATLGAYVLPRLMAEFNELYPQVRLQLVTGNSENIQTRVLESAVDLGYIDLPVVDKALSPEVVAIEPLLLICTPDHPLAESAEASLSEVLDYEYISREPGSGTRAVIDAHFAKAGLAASELKTVMELGSPEALKGVVRTGLGFAIAPPSIVREEIAAGLLVTRPLNPPLQRQVSLIMPRERFRSRTISGFIDFVRTRFRQGI